VVDQFKPLEYYALFKATFKKINRIADYLLPMQILMREVKFTGQGKSRIHAKCVLAKECAWRNKT